MIRNSETTDAGFRHPLCPTFRNPRGNIADTLKKAQPINDPDPSDNFEDLKLVDFDIFNRLHQD